MSRTRQRRRPVHARDRCGPTKKWRYRTRSAAEMALREVQALAAVDPRRHETHVYACRLCAGWHLSSTGSR